MSRNKLPQVPALKTKPSRFNRSSTQSSGSCVTVLNNLLNCWASYAEGATQCVALETAVKDCMLNRKYVHARGNSMGRDSARLLPKINPKPHD